MEKHGAEALYSVVESLMHASRTEDEEFRQDAVRQMVHIAKPWTIWRWLETNHVKGKLRIQIPMVIAHRIDLE